MIVSSYLEQEPMCYQICLIYGCCLPSLYSRTVGPEFDKARKKFLGPCFAVGSSDTSVQLGLFLGHLICQLSAEVFFLLNIFFGKGGREVFGLEDLADLYLAFARVRVGTALDPLDGLFERLDLPEPEAGDEFLGFGEGAVGDGAVLAGEVDAGAFRGGVKPIIA